MLKVVEFTDKQQEEKDCEKCTDSSRCFVIRMQSTDRASIAGIRPAPTRVTRTAKLSWSMRWSHGIKVCRRRLTFTLFCVCSRKHLNVHYERKKIEKLFPSDRVLDQLHEITVSSSPKSVPTSKKQTAQECNSLGNSYNSSRWRRCSPDPNKMMMGRSPNVGDYNPRRILSTTPTRKGSVSMNAERVGSPSLSGYPVSR